MISELCYPSLAFWSPGPVEMLLIAMVALLLYGGRLPEVAREWGKSFTEFRRGLTGIQSDLNEVIYGEPEKLEYQDSEYHEPDTTHDPSSEAPPEELSEESSEEFSEPTSEESVEASKKEFETGDSPAN